MDPFPEPNPRQILEDKAIERMIHSFTNIPVKLMEDLIREGMSATKAFLIGRRATQIALKKLEHTEDTPQWWVAKDGSESYHIVRHLDDISYLVRCRTCSLEDHEGWACRCEKRNVEVAKKRRKMGVQWSSWPKPKKK